MYENIRFITPNRPQKAQICRINWEQRITKIIFVQTLFSIYCKMSRTSVTTNSTRPIIYRFDRPSSNTNKIIMRPNYLTDERATV